MSKSYFRVRPDDPKAFYLDQRFGVHGDGKIDDTEAIKAAIRTLYETEGIGILFIPEGEYVISDTILIPKGVRLIGYGENRPRIRLVDHAPGFDQPVPGDKGGSRYMLWFTTDLPAEPEGAFMDANAGTFYSSLENIDLYVGQGNTNAVAVRSHFAQHCFIAHCDFHIESGRAGIFDVGNEAEDLHFYGGQYGIISTQCSPGWPFVLLDSSFEGHSKAAVRCSHVGFIAIRNQIKNTPICIYIEDGDFEKLLIQDSLLENISDSVISSDSELSPANHQNALNLHCKNVPVFFKSRTTGETICADEKDYLMEEYHYGMVVPELGEKARMDILFKASSLEGASALPESDLPVMPDVSEWVNIRSLGARGDGRTDDTAVLKMAIEKYKVIYLPLGRYVVTDTIKLKKDTILIGLHPYATQLLLLDRTPAFDGFGSAKAVLETPERGNNIVNGLGIDAGGANPRASACIWRGSEHSCMRDVRLIGCHGSMTMSNDARSANAAIYNESVTYDAHILRDWDNQYPSLWVQGGGGIFKNVWSASSYASMGLCVENTSVPAKVYCMSLEHHMRQEGYFSNVQGWSIYALQTEEEVAESSQAVALEFSHCRNMRLFNTFLYRVSRLHSSFPYAIRTNCCENMEFYGLHNFSQSRYVFKDILMDMGSGKSERCWELTRLTITKPEPRLTALSNTPEQLYKGFRFADSVCTDSEGNFYFTDAEAKRIYRIDGETLELSIVHELMVKPFTVACDTQDNLIIVAEYLAPRAESTKRPTKQSVVFTVKNGEMCPLPLQENVASNASRIYSGSHRHTVNDFVKYTMNVPQQCYVAPDGITMIPAYADLLRARCLIRASAGDDIYCVDEFCGRTFRFTLDQNGILTNPKLLVERGESCAIAKDGKVYVCDGQVTIYSAEGEEIGQICLTDRPSGIAIGGKDNDTLLIAAQSDIYVCKI